MNCCGPDPFDRGEVSVYEFCRLCECECAGVLIAS